MWEFIKNNLWLIIGIVAGVILIAMIIAIVVVKTKSNKTVQQISISDDKQPKEQEKAEVKTDENQEVAEPAKAQETKENEPKQESKKEVSEKQPTESKPAKKPRTQKAKEETKTEPAKKETAPKTKEVKAKPEEVAKEPEAEDVAKEDTEVKVKNQKYMVTYDKERKDWVIKKTGGARASKRCKTKKEAMEIVERLAENQELNVSVKKKDGKFQKAENAKKYMKKDSSNQGE